MLPQSWSLAEWAPRNSHSGSLSPVTASLANVGPQCQIDRNVRLVARLDPAGKLACRMHSQRPSPSGQPSWIEQWLEQERRHHFRAPNLLLVRPVLVLLLLYKYMMHKPCSMAAAQGNLVTQLKPCRSLCVYHTAYECACPEGCKQSASSLLWRLTYSIAFVAALQSWGACLF